MRRFYGKYRGKVRNNKDPFHLGRIQVAVPSIYGPDRDAWAMPCTPYAGQDIGWFAIPPINTNVWIEFEGGDSDYPIWVGCFWAVDQLPQVARVEEPEKVQVFKTNGITIIGSSLGDTKKLSIEVDTPVVDRKLKVVFNQDGIEINNKDETTIKLKADQIELKNKTNSIVTILADSITQKESSVELKLTGNTIELTCNPATIKLATASGIELNNPPGNVKINSSGVELTSTSTSVKMTPASIELSNTAANVKLSPISVNVNNGALEVI
jgi:hypothetical protein